MNIAWKTEKRLLKELIPFNKNPRTLSKNQYQALKESLMKFDLVEIPAINSDNTIIAGHQRIRILSDSKGNNHEIEVRVPSRKLTDDEFREYLIQGGSAYVFYSDFQGLNFRKAFVESGFDYKQCCIWVKNIMVMGRQNYHWQHEPILYGCKKGAKHFWNSDRKQTTIWNFDRPQQNKEHPTMKPLDLISYPILNSSKKNQIVLDVFGGSGSTLIASEKLGRICRTMELDPRYCDVIVKRYITYCKENNREFSVTRNGKPCTVFNP